MIKDPEVQKEMDQISVRVKYAIQSLRELMNDLRPPALIRFGFSRTVQAYAEEFREKYPHIQLETDLVDDENLLSEQARLNLFRIIQEALHNAIKHSSATKIIVQSGQLDHHFVLEIRDNGKGFSLPENLIDFSAKGSYGLVGMTERAEAIGGRLNVISEPGIGTTIKAIVPWMRDE